MRIAAALGRFRRPLDLLDARLSQSPAGAQRHAVGGERRHVAVVEINHAAGVFDQRQGVGSQQRGAVGQPHRQRAALPRGHDQPRLIDANHAQRIGAVDSRQRLFNRRDQVACVTVADQMRDDFRIGVRSKIVPIGLQLVPQFGKVLDDAVVNQRDSTGGITVRVRVLVRGISVGRPARMADADGRARGTVQLRQLGFEVRHAAGRAYDIQFAVGGQQRYAGRVIAAVLQELEAGHEDRRRRLRANISDDSAHGVGMTSACRFVLPQMPPPPYGMGAGIERRAFGLVFPPAMTFPADAEDLELIVARVELHGAARAVDVGVDLLGVELQDLSAVQANHVRMRRTGRDQLIIHLVLREAIFTQDARFDQERQRPVHGGLADPFAARLRFLK